MFGQIKKNSLLTINLTPLEKCQKAYYKNLPKMNYGKNFDLLYFTIVLSFFLFLEKWRIIFSNNFSIFYKF